MISLDKVSIVMPCFNAAVTVQESIAGIMEQSYPHWELIVVIDGSEDQTQELVQKMAGEDSRIRVVVSKKNRGVVRSRNIAIRLASGNWIGFCDADDVWLQEKLTLQLDAAKKNAANLVCTSFQFIDAKGNANGIVHTSSKIHWHRLLRTNPIPMSTAIYSLPCRYYFPEIGQKYIHEDYAFWLTMFQRYSMTAVNLPVVTTQIRQVKGSRSANKWLAAKSHGYILRNYGLQKGLCWFILMVQYGFNALNKRFKNNFN